MADEIDQAAAFGRAYQRLVEMAKTDPEIAGVFSDTAITEAMRKPGLTYAEVVATALAGYASRAAVGSRAYEIRRGPDGRNRRSYFPAFETMTYGELARRIEALAVAWKSHPVHRIAPDEFACLIGFTSAEMAVADLACAYAQIISMPVQANLPAVDMLEILNDAEPAMIIATIGNLELAAGYAEQVASIRSLVAIDYERRDDDERDRFERVGRACEEAGGRVKLVAANELIEFGRGLTWHPLPARVEGPDATVMLMYSSGSTGSPKGAMIHEAMCSALWTAAPAMPAIQLAYAPMNHFMGRGTVFNTLATGGRVNFTLRSDMSTLFEDLRLTRPTFLVFMPRVAEIIYQQYQSDLQRRVAAGEDPGEADRAVRAQMAGNMIGDRIVGGGVGSAPTAPEVQQFLRDCFDIAFSNGYSSTEVSSTAVISGGTVLRDVVIDYKLIDVPELGYYTTDKPFPRGEFLVKSRLAIKGYFKRPEATAAILDEEGWVHTGDIMVELGPDRLEWIDRRSNVIKLSQAEFVAIGPLEATFLGSSKLIRQIYIYGSSYRSFLLAVVVPDLDVARVKLDHEPSTDELRRLVLEDLQEAARAANLKTFEVPRDVIIELEPFTHENGLLSSVRKPLRPKLKQRYQPALEALYSEMDRQQEEEVARLRRGDSGLSTIERVAGALKATLGLAELDPQSTQSFSDLGGDSLGAVSLSLLLEEIFGVAVPVSVTLGPATTIARLAWYVEHQSETDSTAPATFTSVHGEGATVVRASDLTLEAFLDPATLHAAETAERPASEAHTVLVTGATGFLGRFVCLEWMEHLAVKGHGKVICLVRGRNDAQARERLAGTFGEHDAELAARFSKIAQNHLEVVAADLALPRLGMDQEVFARLAAEVDQIVHPGALVNHVLNYQSLFEPNVAGTADLIRLALSTKLKRFDYVSTFGVPQMHPGLGQADEYTDVRLAAPEMELSEGYAQGYGISKWASEVLLREANDHFGLPVTVYRPDMILAHSHCSGQINVPDMFTRLLFSLVHTGIAPESFYERPAGSRRPRTHYDGMPVDFLAGAIQQLGSMEYNGFRCYNTTSTSIDDGVSLDTIADWVESAGYPLRRIEDHGSWVHEFETRMRNLPPDERQHSSLPILSFLERPHSPEPTSISTDRFVAAVHSISAGPEIPRLSERFIHKYLNDMRLLGLIGQPG